MQSGYVYKRAPQSTAWQQRFVTLSTDTGTMKFFAEKSGNRIQKGSVSIKQGIYRVLEQIDIGHPFAFEIRMEELIGKTDEAILVLSVDTQEQLNQWKEWIHLGINSEQRRTSIITSDNNRETTVNNSTPTRAKSLLSSVFPTIENNEYISPTGTNESISEMQATIESLSIETSPAIASVSIDNNKTTTTTTVVDGAALPLPVMNRPQKPNSRKPSRTKEFLSSELTSYEATNKISKARETDNTINAPIPENETSVPFTTSTNSLSKLLNNNQKDTTTSLEVNMDDVYIDKNTAMTTNPLAVRRKASTITTTPATTTATADVISTSDTTTAPDITSPDGKALASRLEAKLTARRQSFKPPNFKNLLNSKGMDAAPRRSAAAGGTHSSRPGSEVNSDTEVSAATATNQSQQRRTLSMALRSNVTPSPIAGSAPQPITDQHIQLPESSTTESPASTMLSSDNNTTTSAAGEGLQPRRSFTKSPARRRTSKKSTAHSTADVSAVGIAGHEGDSSRSVTPSPIPPESIAQHPHPLTRHLKIRVRPTEPYREGYLFKLDTAHHQDAEGLGQDVWLLQFAKLDITTGMMQVFSEINGKRIQRSKFDVNACTIKSIDSLFHSRLHCFKVSYRPEDNPNEKKLTTVFAASDEETRNYWLVSFEDCEVYYHTHMQHIQQNPIPPVVPAATPTTTTTTGIAEVVADSSKANPLLAKPIAVVATAASAISLHPNSNNTTTDNTNSAKSSEPGKITPADLMNALKKRNSIKTPAVEGAPTAAAAEEQAEEDQLQSSASMHPFAAALHSRFASAPAVGKTQTKASTLIDATPYSSSEAMGLQRVNTLNMDQLLNMSPLTSPKTHTHPTTNPLPLLKEEEETSSSTCLTPLKYNYTNYQFTMNKLYYPAERLARRIKIWYCSSGFSLTNTIEVEQFVKELRNTGDQVLIDFSEEKFGDLNDWANLLAVLRKYEQRKLLETASKSSSTLHCNSIKLDLKLINNTIITNTGTTTAAITGTTTAITGTVTENATSSGTSTTTTANKDNSDSAVLQETGKDESVQVQINADISALEIAQQISKHINIPEKEIIESAGLTQLLFNKETNVFGRAMGVLNDDLTFAEDLILYQEEVIDHVWVELEQERAKVHERDETIEELYQRLRTVEEAAKRGKLSSISHPVQDNPSWLTEKNSLLQVHNDEKVKLITEIQTLRKALTPTTEDLFNKWKYTELRNKSLEDEVISSYLKNDALKAEVAELKDQLQEAEDERTAVETHWQEKLDALKAEHATAIAKLRAEIQKTQVEAKKNADEAASLRRLSVRAPPSVPASASSAAPSTVPSTAPSPAPSSVPHSNILISAPDYTFSGVDEHTDNAVRFSAFSTTTSTAQSSAAPSPYLSSPLDLTGQTPAVVATANTRNLSPKRTAESSTSKPRYTNKPYVNHYASFEDPSEQKPSESPAPVSSNTVTSQQQQQYQPYSYSMELKEDAHVPVQGALQIKAPSPEMWGIASGPNSNHSARSGTSTMPMHTMDSGSFSGNTSVASLRRDELMDPDDEHDGTYTPSAQAQQQRTYINNDNNKAVTATTSDGWTISKKAMHNSLRLMRLPQSGTSSPMPPVGSFPGTPTGPGSMPPPSPSTTLQVPRAQVKPNPIRAAIRNDSLHKRQTSSTGKSGGVYMTPHAASYAVMPTSRPSGGVPSPMVSPMTPQQQHSMSFMSATKASSRSEQLGRQSAAEAFAKTFSFKK